MTNNNDNKEQVTKQLQSLLAQMAKQKNGSSQDSPQETIEENPQPQSWQQRALLLVQNSVTLFRNMAASATHNIDRLINFIVKSNDPDRNEIVQYARPPILFGLAVMVIFVIFGGFWAALAPLDSAAHAMGVLTFSINRQIVSYAGQGGTVVKTICVKQGDVVKANQPILEMDDTRAKSDYDASLNYYISVLAKENRLLAERDEASQIEFSSFITEHNSSETQKILKTQVNEFNSNKELLTKSIAHIQKNKQQHMSSLASLQKQLTLAKSRAGAGKALKLEGHISHSDAQELDVRESDISSRLAATKQEIEKCELEVLTKLDQNKNRISKELFETQIQRASSAEKFLMAKDALEKVIVRSPVDGIVNLVTVHTIGALLPNQAMVAEITPVNDHLIIDARIPAANNDSITVGQQAKIKFLAFKSRTSPLFMGTVVSISPDTIQDQQAAASFAHNNKMMARAGDLFYVAKIELDMEEFNRIAKPRGLKLIPGMSADIQIVTGTRTLLRYLVDPVRDQAYKAFKER